MKRTKFHKFITTAMTAAVSLSLSFSILTVSPGAAVRNSRSRRSSYTVHKSSDWLSMEEISAKKAKSRLEKNPVQIYVNVEFGDPERPILNNELYDRILKATGVSVNKKDLPESLDTWGFYDIKVNLYKDITATVKVEVLPPEDSYEPLNYPDSKYETELFKRRIRKLVSEGHSVAEAIQIIRDGESKSSKTGDLAAKYHKHLERKEAEEKKKVLKGKHVQIYLRAGVNGKPFGSVSRKDITNAIKKTFGLRIDTRNIEPENLNVKQFGTYDIRLNLHKFVRTSMKVDVLPATDK